VGLPGGGGGGLVLDLGLEFPPQLIVPTSTAQSMHDQSVRTLVVFAETLLLCAFIDRFLSEGIHAAVEQGLKAREPRPRATSRTLRS
jgi:hypothetical protein